MGSARVSRVGERVLALADFSWNPTPLNVAMFLKSLFRRDADTSTLDACATLARMGANYMTMPPSTHSTWPVM
jgi:hypothetical protein